MKLVFTGFLFGLGCVLAYVFVLVALVLLCAFIVDRDDTDPPTGARSQLDLHIDNKTGCHYLSARNGGLTPRLDADGKHICTKGKEGGQ